MKRYFVAGIEISEAEMNEIVKKNTEYLKSEDTHDWLKIKHIIVVDDGKEEKGMISNPYSFEYQLLDRCKGDCEYFLGAGNGMVKYLWGGSVEEHIAKMRELYALLPEKPEWLTLEVIDKYEKLMNERERRRTN